MQSKLKVILISSTLLAVTAGSAVYLHADIAPQGSKLIHHSFAANFTCQRNPEVQRTLSQDLADSYHTYFTMARAKQVFTQSCESDSRACGEKRVMMANQFSLLLSSLEPSQNVAEYVKGIKADLKIAEIYMGPDFSIALSTQLLNHQLDRYGYAELKQPIEMKSYQQTFYPCNDLKPLVASLP